jgi:hypothetical protein
MVSLAVFDPYIPSALQNTLSISYISVMTIYSPK